jgi:hypothetical protein
MSNAMQHVTQHMTSHDVGMDVRYAYEIIQKSWLALLAGHKKLEKYTGSMDDI